MENFSNNIFLPILKKFRTQLSDFEIFLERHQDKSPIQWMKLAYFPFIETICGNIQSLLTFYFNLRIRKCDPFEKQCFINFLSNNTRNNNFFHDDWNLKKNSYPLNDESLKKNMKVWSRFFPVPSSRSLFKQNWVKRKSFSRIDSEEIKI